MLMVTSCDWSLCRETTWRFHKPSDKGISPDRKETTLGEIPVFPRVAEFCRGNLFHPDTKRSPEETNGPTKGKEILARLWDLFFPILINTSGGQVSDRMNDQETNHWWTGSSNVRSRRRRTENGNFLDIARSFFSSVPFTGTRKTGLQTGKECPTKEKKGNVGHPKSRLAISFTTRQINS